MWQHMFSMPITRTVWRRELDIVTIIQAHHSSTTHQIWSTIFFYQSSMYMYKKSIGGEQFAFGVIDNP
jgi:hypothetical protein